MAYKKINKEINLAPIMEFLQKYWLIIAGLIFALPWIKNYVDEMNAKNKRDSLENAVEVKEKLYETNKDLKRLENLNPLTQKQKRLKITGSSELWAASQRLAQDFGVKYADGGRWFSFMHPRGLTENDEAIRNTLLKYRAYFTKIEKLYFEVDTAGRSLRSDILEYLDNEDLALVRKGLKI